MAAGCRTAMLLLALALSGMSPPAQAQPAPSNAVTSSSPATEQPAPAPQAGRANAGPDCHAPLPPVPPRGNQRMTVALTDASPGTRGAIWQPRGGEVSFTVTSADGTALGAMNIVACFRWHDGRDQNDWVASPVPLRVIAAAPGTITYGARVPDLPAVQSWWFARVLGAAEQEEFAGLWIVPIADFRVVATSDADWKTLDTVVPVGVTSVAFSSLLALIGVLGAWFMLYSFGDRRGVPGRDVVLKLISTRNGYASLSQLQTLMWSFVVGAAGIYVMALSGNLIDISNGTLVLLGITGVAFVGSKLQSHIDDKARDPSAPQAAQPVTPAAPSAVAGLLPVPGGITDGEVRLTWAGADRRRPACQLHRAIPAERTNARPVAHADRHNHQTQLRRHWLAASQELRFSGRSRERRGQRRLLSAAERHHPCLIRVGDAGAGRRPEGRNRFGKRRGAEPDMVCGGRCDRLPRAIPCARQRRNLEWRR